ncbi:hypothetical protein BO70DRAFT_342180 [Aspergillus heteromorphus CBS 117.55]|uniref:IgE-binding protein n=1 Tax=Aspergillus heteromorphus CBS 117.55 TaxID=1448321 RepID=A0A317VD38_9EURO|nr:uncharacterized protein BO70DRAFT_342180 [Aspergillus heteromorphus CBS 117.55]PWY72284.1 hypothetical protein BO70DRAFT_342180 [Aspergillus heteromorphus CBS 117.55]
MKILAFLSAITLACAQGGQCQGGGGTGAGSGPGSGSGAGSGAGSGSSSTSSSSVFTVTASRSGSSIHQLALNANGGYFYLGGRTSTYCPPGVEAEGGCPPGNATAIDGGTALSVSVPGGQQIYVTSKGALAFTQPHSAYIPPGSSTGPFYYSAGDPTGTWSFDGGFMACPIGGGAGSSSAGASSSGSWQVFANWSNATVPGGDVNACLGFQAVTVGRNVSVEAWEYI